jgi:AraC family transcriptional regulator
VRPARRGPAAQGGPSRGQVAQDSGNDRNSLRYWFNYKAVYLRHFGGGWQEFPCALNRPQQCSLMIPSSLTLAATAYRPNSRHPAHTHDELQVTIVLTGSVCERVGSQIECAEPLSVVVKDPGVRHADDFGAAGAVTARLSARHITFSDLVEHPRRSPDWRWLHGGGSAARPFLQLVFRRAAGETMFSLDDADLVDLFAAVSARHCRPARGQPPAWLRNTVAHIRDGWHPELRMRDVAHAARVHPVYLARCLRRWYGISGAEMLRQSRFRYAAKGVADDDGTFASVACATGFADEAHLSRAFSAIVGVPPGRFRRLTRMFSELASVRPSVSQIRGPKRSA